MGDCPFCGSHDSRLWQPPYGGYSVMCGKCGAEGPIVEAGVAEEAERLWNARASTERLARLEAALRDAEPVLQAMWSGKNQDVLHSQVAKARLSCAAALSPRASAVTAAATVPDTVLAHRHAQTDTNAPQDTPAK